MGKLCMNSDLDSEHLGIGNAPPPPKKSCLFVHVRGLVSKIILLGYDFFVAAIIRDVAKVYM